jgi:hypothetical protein
MGLERQAIFLRERAGKTLRFERAHLDQRISEVLSGLLTLSRAVKILLRDP